MTTTNNTKATISLIRVALKNASSNKNKYTIEKSSNGYTIKAEKNGAIKSIECNSKLEALKVAESIIGLKLNTAPTKDKPTRSIENTRNATMKNAMIVAQRFIEKHLKKNLGTKRNQIFPIFEARNGGITFFEGLSTKSPKQVYTNVMNLREVIAIFNMHDQTATTRLNHKRKVS